MRIQRHSTSVGNGLQGVYMFTFSMGKSNKGDEIAAAAASCALDLP